MSTIKGTAGNDKLNGTTSADLIYGYAGNDTINGGSGADTMYGGTGNDLYYVDNSGDKIIENSAEGTDTVISTISYVLGSYVENLTLSGSSNINATGNNLNNYLKGNTGNNVINGKAGADTMVGGKGNDTYYVDNTGDIVKENDKEGNDTVISTISYSLGNCLEKLTLSGSSKINGTGNSYNNSIIGNIGNNILKGAAGNDTINGGSSADTMYGGTGNDIYYVDNNWDKVIENSNEGTDKVYSSISYTLPDNVENLNLSVANNLNGTGNKLNNYIIGNDDDNILDGKAGADTMEGGSGSDTYYIDNVGDKIIEDDSYYMFSMDTAISSASYTLASGVEDLILSGNSNINGYGNDLDNIILGNSGNNTLRGANGNDTLSGDYGNDTYSINQGTDLINDFGGNDKILFESSIDKSSIAFYVNGFNLDFAYGDDNYLTIQDQSLDNAAIEKVQLSNKYYLTSDEINSVIQQMDSFAASNGILLTNVADVKANQDLMNIIASAWHS